MEAWNLDGTPYIVQFDLPIPGLRIADFRDWPSDHLVTAVFGRAEGCKVAGRGPDSYEFSQMVGELVSAHFDGMILPGVRGAPGAHYSNVVLFCNLDSWGTWTVGCKPRIQSGSHPSHEDIAVAGQLEAPLLDTATGLASCRIRAAGRPIRKRGSAKRELRRVPTGTRSYYHFVAPLLSS